MKLRTLLTLFLSALSVECAANAFGVYWLQFLSKPSLMALLFVYFAANTRRFGGLKYFVFAALFFSWLGDVFLLIEKRHDFLFVFGLAAFLIAHVCYLIFFYRIAGKNRARPEIKRLPTAIVLIYSVLFYVKLLPNLSVLRIPVLIYVLIIGGMLIASFRAFDFEKQRFGWIVLAGTLLFAVSDSVLAINRFLFPIPLGSVLVMLTYSLGQLLITEGSLRNLRDLK